MQKIGKNKWVKYDLILSESVMIGNYQIEWKWIIGVNNMFVILRNGKYAKEYTDYMMNRLKINVDNCYSRFGNKKLEFDECDKKN